MSKLREILDKTIIRETEDKHRYGDMFVSLDKGKTWVTTEEAIQQWALDIVGEDEEDAGAYSRNKLRAELREKIRGKDA